MFGIGTTELVVVAIVAVLVLGPERCIKSFRSAGKLWRMLRAEWVQAKQAIDDSERN